MKKQRVYPRIMDLDMAINAATNLESKAWDSMSASLIYYQYPETGIKIFVNDFSFDIVGSTKSGFYISGFMSNPKVKESWKEITKMFPKTWDIRIDWNNSETQFHGAVLLNTTSWKMLKNIFDVVGEFGDKININYPEKPPTYQKARRVVKAKVVVPKVEDLKIEKPISKKKFSLREVFKGFIKKINGGSK